MHLINRKKLFLNIPRAFFLTAYAVVFSLMFYLAIHPNTDKYSVHNHESYYVVKDYTVSVINDESAPVGIRTEYVFSIDDTSAHDTEISFYTVHQYAEVYIGDEKVYALYPHQSSISKTVGSNWAVIPIEREYFGKDMRVVITPVYKSFADRTPEFFMGDTMDIFKRQLSIDAIPIMLSIALTITGIVFLSIGLYYSVKHRRPERLLQIGIFSVMLGVWKITDTRFITLAFTDKPVFIYYLSITMLMIGTIPMIRFTKAEFGRLSRTLCDIYCILASTLCIIQIVLQFVGVADIRETLALTHMMIAICAGLMLVMFFYDFVTGKEKKHRVMKLPIICIIGVVADITIFYISNSSAPLIYSLLSAVIYIVMFGVITLVDYIEQDRLIVKQKSELAESRMSIMLSQIRPHFLYNSIGAIRELCRVDPERAREALGDFAHYLRGNMDTLAIKEMIPFKKELDHIEAYLKLEKMRFGDKLSVVYNIEEEDFLIPPLTVQPLVENAVKHGICNLESDDGILVLSTHREDDCIVICIADNGVGFDSEELSKDDGRSHIGIDNVRDRLSLMANGKLTIESAPGKGTNVKIIVNSPNS